MQAKSGDDHPPGNGAAVLAEQKGDAEQTGEAENSLQEMHVGIQNLQTDAARAPTTTTAQGGTFQVASNRKARTAKAKSRGVKIALVQTGL